MNRTHLAAACAALTLMTAVGCRVESTKQDGTEHVSVVTPFGGVKVKANDSNAVDGLDLPVYPGATLEKKDKNNGSADVNLSFGNFQFRVKAAGYRTTDSSEKVEAFYRDALRKFGTVIACDHNQPIGTPTSTDQGLNCSDDNKHVHVGAKEPDNSKMELKVGSKQHQHIVGIEPTDGGTKFGLVALDLPSSLTGEGDSDARQ